VFKGTWLGLTVAIKCLTPQTSQKVCAVSFFITQFIESLFLVQLLLNEVKIWSILTHDHVLPFYGASLSPTAPFIVSRYMENGNMTYYLRRMPNANRVQLVRLLG
jgi:serine/threonine protein kinase